MPALHSHHHLTKIDWAVGQLKKYIYLYKLLNYVWITWHLCLFIGLYFTNVINKRFMQCTLGNFWAIFPGNPILTEGTLTGYSPCGAKCHTQLIIKQQKPIIEKHMELGAIDPLTPPLYSQMENK